MSDNKRAQKKRRQKIEKEKEIENRAEMMMILARKETLGEGGRSRDIHRG